MDNSLKGALDLPYYQRSPFDFRQKMSPAVRRLMQFLSAVYVLQVLLAQFVPSTYVAMYRELALDYAALASDFRLWQLITYAVLHDVQISSPHARPLLDLFVCIGLIWGIYRGSLSNWTRREPMLFLIAAFASIFLIGQLGFGAPFHLGGNLLFFYFFGPLFERYWGPQRFLIFCLLSALGGAILSFTLSLTLSPRWVGTGAIGASGATMGLLMAYAVYYKNETVLAGFVVPMKAWHLLVLVVVFDVISLLSPNSGVAFFVHMGGLLTGWLLTTGNWRFSKLLHATKLSKLRRRKDRPSHLRVVRDDDDNPWIH
ncbi:MAG: rhomboid family intramembrane serine protease [Myxococcota bacterium]|nr:rhomboid family intramembrane serine protease [Myxococcota bacterium]